MGEFWTKMEKYQLWGLSIKAVTGVLGISVILTENHPYIAIIVLCIGAGANEWVSMLEKKERRMIEEKNAEQ